MKRDIKHLFKVEETNLKTLPKLHRTEFLEKLKKQPNKKSIPFYWLKIAAVLLIALVLSYTVFYNTSKTVEVSPIIAQVEAIEAEYLNNIETEWQNFIALTDDEVLVERFKNKLEDLDNDYKAISIQFKEHPNTILVIETLIENLQTRLTILKDIQKHINILNQKKRTL